MQGIIIRSYFKNLWSTKLENLKEMDSFLVKFHIQKLNQDLVHMCTKYDTSSTDTETNNKKMGPPETEKFL